MGDLDAVVNAVAGSEELDMAVKTMLLEGMPLAIKGDHRYQREFIGLTGGVLEGSKQHVAAELASIEADVQKAEEELEAIKQAEVDAVKALEEAAAATATAEA